MVAMRTLDMVVGLSWMGLLATVLVGQAVLAWWRYRWANRLAGKAERLSRSLEHERSTGQLGRVSGSMPASQPGPVGSHR
jgi:hypothetical protein